MYADKYCVIYDYNNRLKEPLTKGIVCNSNEPPMRGDYGLDAPEFNTYKHPQECYQEDLRIYEEAEKECIFKDSKIGWCEDGLDVFEINGFEICFNNHTNKWHTADEEIYLETIGDLFRATNGELELKNFEI